MAEQQQIDYSDVFSEFNIKIADMGERQRLSKERLLLLGKNLLETRTDLKEEINEIKKEFFEIKQNVKKIKDATSRLLEETENFARKEELAILQRQFKMFQPLEYVRIEDVKSILNKLRAETSETNKEKDIKTENSSHKKWYY